MVAHILYDLNFLLDSYTSFKKGILENEWHYGNTNKDSTYNNFTYNINKCEIK